MGETTEDILADPIIEALDKEIARLKAEFDRLKTKDALAAENARLKAEFERLSARINRMVPSAAIEDVQWRPAS